MHFHQSANTVLLAAVMGAVSVPYAVTADAADQIPVEISTWIGYQLRSENGGYLTVANGTAGDIAMNAAANGVASYNIWYFTEVQDGTAYTLKSALSQGEYYLTAGDKWLDTELALEDGSQYFQVYVIEGNKIRLQQGETVYGIYTLEPVTWLKPGDMNRDNKLNVVDTILAKRAVQYEADFSAASIGDVNTDGVFHAADIAEMQSFLVRRKMDLPTADVQLPDNTIFPTHTALTETNTTTTTTTTMTTKTTTALDATSVTTTTVPVQEIITFADLPERYQYAADWIWENRVEKEQSTARWNTIFDQIVAGDGTLNYVIRWQSYKTVTLEQRQQFEQMIEDSVNAWTDWLVGYENWPYEHIDVKVVGWAVLDKNCLLDLQPDEVVYDNLISDYDSGYDTSNGIEEIPDKLPSAPSELSRFDHFTETDYVYPGERFDMYLWATQGFPSIGGCGGDWGQRLSDDAYLNMLSGTGIHVLEHEIGHGFGLTDFYGGEGEADGFPPGGFPDDGTSLMMAGSSAKVTDFDGWMLRYLWSQIQDEAGRFVF